MIREYDVRQLPARVQLALRRYGVGPESLLSLYDDGMVTLSRVCGSAEARGIRNVLEDQSPTSYDWGEVRLGVVE